MNRRGSDEWAGCELNALEETDRRMCVADVARERARSTESSAQAAKAVGSITAMAVTPPL